MDRLAIRCSPNINQLEFFLRAASILGARVYLFMLALTSGIMWWAAAKFGIVWLIWFQPAIGATAILGILSRPLSDSAFVGATPTARGGLRNQRGRLLAIHLVHRLELDLHRREDRQIIFNETIEIFMAARQLGLAGVTLYSPLLSNPKRREAYTKHLSQQLTQNGTLHQIKDQGASDSGIVNKIVFRSAYPQNKRRNWGRITVLHT